MPGVAKQILTKNPRNIMQWFRCPYDKKFVSFKASLDEWLNGCRPLLGLDGCFLKGKYSGIILSVIGLDGNNGLFLIAIFIATDEHLDSWRKFLNILKPYLIKHKDPLTFISDRQKGMVPAVNEMLPNSNHRFCQRHM